MAFSTINALMVNVYRRMGHGAKLTSSYTARLFPPCSCHTDLLHWAHSVYDTNADFIAQCQQSTTDWGLLTLATGGALKQSKCSIYSMLYKFVNGRAKLKRLRGLPTPSSKLTLENEKAALSHINIPQPDGSTCAIQTLNVTDSSKMLGIKHYSH